MTAVPWLPGRWRTQLGDLLLAVFMGAFSTAGTFGAAERASADRRELEVLTFVLVLTAAAGLVVRRRWPLVTLAVTVGATAVYLARAYPWGPVIGLMAFAVFSAALHAPVRRSLIGTGVAAAAVYAGALIGAAQDLLTSGAIGLAAVAGWLAAPWAVGALLRIRRETTVRTREEARRRSGYEQRLQIARDVHDVVGHGLAVINMQAGIALHVLEKRPEQAAVALDAIKRTSKEALDELRATLAVYRSADPAPRAPTAGLAQLDALVATTAESGLPVTLEVSGDVTELPASLDLAAYRIVQESLTNVLRHAGPASATVRVTHEPGAVVLEITDDGRGSGGNPPGHGLTGMSERAAAVGGSLDAGPCPGGGFAVRARLPVAE